MREFAHEITVPLPPAEALQLFTPKGEEARIDEWRPAYLEPADGATRTDVVFVLAHLGREAGLDS